MRRILKKRKKEKREETKKVGINDNEEEDGRRHQLRNQQKKGEKKVEMIDGMSEKHPPKLLVLVIYTSPTKLERTLKNIETKCRRY